MNLESMSTPFWVQDLINAGKARKEAAQLEAEAEQQRYRDEQIGLLHKLMIHWHLPIAEDVSDFTNYVKWDAFCVGQDGPELPHVVIDGCVFSMRPNLTGYPTLCIYAYSETTRTGYMQPITTQQMFEEYVAAAWIRQLPLHKSGKLFIYPGKVEDNE